MPGAEVFLFGEDGIRRVDYTETPHYQITKQFLSAPDRMLRILFGEA
jgi:predicted ATPase